MPRPRSPDRDRARKIYQEADGDIALTDIAEQLKVPEGTVRGWKNKDNWDGKLNGTFRKNMERSKHDKKVSRKLAASVEDNDELTEKEKIFCVYYVQTFNATQAAIGAGYSQKTAYSIGYNLMHKPRIAAEITRLKAIKAEAILAGPEDVVGRMVEIGFSGEHDSTSLKALEWVAHYLNIDPQDKHRRDYDTKRLELQERFVQVQEQKNEHDDGNDGQLMDLLKGLKQDG